MGRDAMYILPGRKNYLCTSSQRNFRTLEANKNYEEQTIKIP